MIDTAPPKLSHVGSFDYEPFTRLVLMSAHERLIEFLGLCNKRGKWIRSDRDAYPDMIELARICQTNVSTISRIASGKQQAVKFEVLDILYAIACISPPILASDWAVYMSEQRLRVDDARTCLNSGESDREVILAAILHGVHQRLVTCN